MRAIPCGVVTPRGVAKAHVELGKVWAISLRPLKVRAGQCDSKALSHE